MFQTKSSKNLNCNYTSNYDNVTYLVDLNDRRFWHGCDIMVSLKWFLTQVKFRLGTTFTQRHLSTHRTFFLVRATFMFEPSQKSILSRLAFNGNTKTILLIPCLKTVYRGVGRTTIWILSKVTTELCFGHFRRS